MLQGLSRAGRTVTLICLTAGGLNLRQEGLGWIPAFNSSGGGGIEGVRSEVEVLKVATPLYLAGSVLAAAPKSLHYEMAGQCNPCEGALADSGLDLHQREFALHAKNRSWRPIPWRETVELNVSPTG